MKQKIVALGFLMMASCPACAQNTPALSKEISPETFKIKLRTTYKKISYGFLAGINDSAITVSSKRVAFTDSLIEKPFYKTYSYADIRKFSIKKYGNTARGIVYGAIAGAVAGAIMGFVTYDRATNWFGPGPNGIISAVFGAIPGLIIGGVIGSKMTKFNIHGNKEKFKMMKSAILEMSAGKSSFAPKDPSITN